MRPAERPAREHRAPPDTEVRRSDIAGRGLFAAAALPAGTAVVRAGDAGCAVVNHSCDPTLWWDGDTLVTRRAVAAGEELTADYATGDADPDLVLMCHCETYRCRQLISGDDWRIPQLQQRYAGHWRPHLQRLIEAGH